MSDVRGGRRGRRLALASCAVAGWVLLATPSAHAASVASLGGGVASQGSYTLSVHCASVAGATTSLSQVSFVIQAQAESASSSGALGVGTTVVCSIRDGYTGATLGTVSSGLPGPAAEAVGVITIPLASDPYACVGGGAVFSDGGSVNLDPNSNCGPVPPQALERTIDQRLRCPVGCPGPMGSTAGVRPS